MDSNNVRILSSASFTADLNRRVCESEVRSCSVKSPAITLTCYSLSGRDAYDHHFDLAHLYHEPNSRAHPLQVPQVGYAHGELAYASHSSAVPLPGKRTSLLIAIYCSSTCRRDQFSL